MSSSIPKLFYKRTFFTLVIVLILSLIFLFISIPGQTDLIDDSVANLPPVSNPKLDERRHNAFNTVGVLEKVYFVGEDSYDPNPTDNLTFLWNFGDGAFSTEISPIHEYRKVGEYTVTLKINDSNTSDMSELKIYVISQGMNKPIAILKSTSNKDEVGNNYANVSEPIYFNATDSFDPDGFPLTYEWDFGDGTKLTGDDRIVHEFQNDGIFTVIVTVVDKEGLSTSTSIEIVIGTGDISNNGQTGDDSNNDAAQLVNLVLGLIVIIVLFLIMFWIYLSRARKRVLKQVKISETGITNTKPTQLKRPTKPDFAKPSTIKRDQMVRHARVDRLNTYQKKVKKDILREKLASERKKIDDDMKKELEDMGIEL